MSDRTRVNFEIGYWAYDSDKEQEHFVPDETECDKIATVNVLLRVVNNLVVAEASQVNVRPIIAQILASDAVIDGMLAAHKMSNKYWEWYNAHKETANR